MKQRSCRLTGPSNDAVKAMVRERDGQRCTSCGVTREEHIQQTGRGLEVHRLVPGSKYTLEGCVTLCRRCHARGPKRRRGSYDHAYGVKVKISDDLHQRLRETARWNGISPWSLIRMVLHRHLPEWERMARENREARRIEESQRKGGSK